MATLTPQVVVDTGIALTTSAATVTTGDKVPAGEGCFLYVNNGSGGATVVTITTPGTVGNGLAIADRTVSVSTGAIELIAIPAIYADTADSNLATVVCSVVTSVTIAALRV
jgi:hypothetical protein